METIEESDRSVSEQTASLAEPRPARGDTESGDGSMRTRVAALVAMLLLAIGALSVGIWLYFH